MGRRKISGTSRTLREAQNPGVKHPRSREFKKGANAELARDRWFFSNSWLLGFSNSP
jgi:hypothetical protein